MQEAPSPAPARAGATELTLPPSFPAGDYTPHGYLDNPYHTMVLNPSGVIRSVPPLGFGYWLRTFKGGYGTGTRTPVNYLSLLHLSVALGDLRLVSAEDFAAAGIELASRYHTKHVVSYDWSHEEMTFSLKYFLPREHTLACRIEIANAGDTARTVTVHASHLYGAWEQRWWGSDGVGMRYLPDADAAVSAIWAYGHYFALGADVHSVAQKATGDRDQWQDWLRTSNLDARRSATLRGPGPLHSVMSYTLVAPAGGCVVALVCLSRGVNEARVLEELDAGRTGAHAELERQLDRDEAFWSRCPQLDGDWPEVWKHGWVYDWETLRMNVRRPVGIFRHHWDAMQVHSPRSVLGEASVDMLALSHADSELAREVLLGTFADAPLPNVPCCREDGSMNMVAADGQACGTAPVWCFPFKVLRAIYAATGDAAWITELYPYLKSYLDWWLENRADEHGWFYCHCDWESGQDGSKRFPQSEGSDAGSVATVDVEASMVEALRNMVLFAEIADALEDCERWAALAEQKTAATREMFVDGWFRDHDTRSGQPIFTPDHVDLMMLTPLTCGVATAAQIEAVRPKFQWFRDHPTPWLEWPSFFLAYTEAAWTAGQRLTAAEATADIADRVYPRIDSRALRFAEPAAPYAYRVPGVACEYWPISDDIEPGGENYGWGATLPLHIIRSLVGFRESENVEDVEFYLAPALPARLRKTGASYTLRNLSYRDIEFNVRYDVQDEGRLGITLEYAAKDPQHVWIETADGAPRQKTTEPASRGTLEFPATSGEVFRVRVQPE